ncbi:MAG: tRNA lysidine(34) synthetase TilS [Clostridiales bacterium]|nr:MAG: tRNA lysidine(34) synthetase TilS [Clostridiales bacterium]
MYEKEVEANLRRLVQNGEKLGVAVSGGADSVALATVCVAYGRKTGNEVVFLHFEHGIRGEESLRDMEFVKKLAGRLGVKCIVERGDAAAEAEKEKESLEAAARRLRYDFFVKAAEENGIDKVAVAHHREDLAETLLLNLIRGGGIDGMTAMKETREPFFIRPMLRCTREQVTDFLERHRIPFVYDSSNDDVNYARNRVRKELVPLMAEMNPDIVSALMRAYDILLAEGSALQGLADERYQACAREKEGWVDISLDLFDGEPLAIKRRIVRRAIDRVGCITDVELKNVDDIIGLAERRRTGKWMEKNDFRAVVSYDILKICSKSFIIDKYGVFFGKTLEEAARISDAPLPGCFPEESSATQYISKSAAEGAVVRRRRDGDVIRPFGMEGTKKLGDWFTDKKVPMQKRDAAPIVEQNGRIIWVVGYGLSEYARAGEEGAVKVEFGYENGEERDV